MLRWVQPATSAGDLAPRLDVRALEWNKVPGKTRVNGVCAKPVRLAAEDLDRATEKENWVKLVSGKKGNKQGGFVSFKVAFEPDAAALAARHVRIVTLHLYPDPYTPFVHPSRYLSLQMWRNALVFIALPYSRI